MSLKEWKNNELNMLLMKKWGLLKEDKSNPWEAPPEGPGDKGYEEMIAGQKGAEELEEGCPPDEEGGEAIDISAPGMEVHVDDVTQLSPEEAFAAGMAAARDAIDQVMGGPDIEEGMKYRDEDVGSKEHDDEEGNRPSMARDMDLKEDSEERRRERGTHFREGKISVREAKEITRRIIERIKEESS